MNLFCLLRGHQRSAALTVMQSDRHRHSRCERCGAGLVKTWDRGWIREKAA